MAAHLNDRFAIVTGLFNLDGVHRFHAELHPVYMMAVLISSTRGDSLHEREKWAIMIRNLGNQGDCSGGKIGVRTADAGHVKEKLIVDLGWWQGASAVKGALSDAYTTSPYQNVQQASQGGASVEKKAPADEPTFGRRDGHCACVSIDVPRPTQTTDEFTFIGTLNLEWTRSATAGSQDSPLSRFSGWDINVATPLNLKDEPSGQIPARPGGFPDPDMPFRSRDAWLGHDLAQSMEKPVEVARAREDTAFVLTAGRPAVDLGCTTGFFRRLFLVKPECERAWRLFLDFGLNATTTTFTGAVSYYAYPHGFPTFGDFFSTLGYRANVRQIRERAKSGLERGVSHWNSTAIDAPVFVWQPSTFRITEGAKVSPYALFGATVMTRPGTAWRAALPPYVGLQRGIGVEFHVYGLNTAIEYNHAYYFSNVAESTTYALIWHLGPPF
jgi:hypothetical protein